MKKKIEKLIEKNVEDVTAITWEEAEKLRPILNPLGYGVEYHMSGETDIYKLTRKELLYRLEMTLKGYDVICRRNNLSYKPEVADINIKLYDFLNENLKNT